MGEMRNTGHEAVVDECMNEKALIGMCDQGSGWRLRCDDYARLSTAIALLAASSSLSNCSVDLD